MIRLPLEGPLSRRPRWSWAARSFALLALVSVTISWLLLLAGCTVAGSTCGSADACPATWTCSAGRCTPPAPRRRPAPVRVPLSPKEQRHAA